MDGDQWYQGCSNYLKLLGVDNRAEIARVLDIATNPNSLYHSHRDKKREGNSMVRPVMLQVQCSVWSLWWKTGSLEMDTCCTAVELAWMR